MTIEAISGREQVIASIQKAATANQIDFNYLLTQARVESSLNPQAKAKTSSAAGLFQFTSSTWLAVVRRHGDKVGLSSEAAALNSQNVSSTEVSKVLALRQEPAISAEFAARFALDNAKALNAAGHTSVGPTELYLAHFLGAGGATTFLKGLRDAPDAAAAAALPQAANSNTGIFYNGATARSYREIYDRFAQKFSVASTSNVNLPAVAKDIRDGNIRLSLPDQKIMEIAKRVLAENMPSQAKTAQSPSAAPAAPVSTMDKAELGQVTEQALQTYLKGFGLIDQGTGLTPKDGHITRDASRGADLHAEEMSSSNDVDPLAQGSRLVLKAIEPTEKDKS